jgi:hypothetical protein
MWGGGGGGGVDRICWSPSKRKLFEVSSFFDVLSISLDRYEAGCSFPWKGIWKVKVPRRVSFFLCGQLLLVRFSLWIIFAKEV